MNLILVLLMLAFLFMLAWKFKILPFGLMALSEDMDVPAREGELFSYPVATAKKIYAGALIVMNSSGYAEPGTTATGKKALGRAAAQIDNTGGQNGDLVVPVEEGVFRYDNSLSGDAITLVEVGNVCYIVDDHTVAKTSGTGTRSVAGYIRDVDDDGVWVEIRSPYFTGGNLTAANNLSDVTAATARANIGANLVVESLLVADLTSASALIYYIVSPVAGTITKIWAVINGALAVGNATLTGKIGATAITNGVVTLVQSGSAAGDKFYATPSALNVVAAGDVISFTVGGTNTAAKTAEVSLRIET